MKSIWNLIYPRLMAPDGDGGGGGGDPAKVDPAKADPAKADPADPAKADPAKADPAKADPAKADPAKADPAKADPAKADPAKADPAKASSLVNLLGDDTAPDGKAKPKFDYVEGDPIPIGTDSFGNEVEIPADDVKSFLDALPDETGDKAGALRAFASFEAARLAKDTARDLEAAKGLAEESKAEFGADLKRVVGEARRGGKALFGEAWDDLAGIPAFANDKRILRALSNYGRSVTPDSGVVRPTVRKSEGFSAESWIANSNSK